MKKFFTTDIPTKLLALGLAVFLWVYLVVLLNPQIETSFSNIPITYSEHSNLAKSGYVITSETVESVSLKLRGSRNMLANVNKNNISAYIDLSGCSESGSYSLPIHVRLPYDELSIINKTPYNVNIVVDKVIERDFELNIITDGQPKENIHIDSVKPSADFITVRGPSEIIKSIDSVVAYFDVDGIDKDVTETAEVLLLNNRGERIESGFLSLNTAEVDINCTVLVEKTVPVDISKIAIPEGYEIYSVTPKDIVIVGRKEILETINNIAVGEYEFTEENSELTEIALLLPSNVESKDKAVEVVIKKEEENIAVNNENDNQ